MSPVDEEAWRLLLRARDRVVDWEMLLEIAEGGLVTARERLKEAERKYGNPGNGKDA